jgi:hypothetical protein
MLRNNTKKFKEVYEQGALDKCKSTNVDSKKLLRESCGGTEKFKEVMIHNNISTSQIKRKVEQPSTKKTRVMGIQTK